MNPVRIGVLGTAAVTAHTLLRPARQVPGAEVTAVASRTPARAAKYAAAHGIPHVHQDYAALLADDTVDAVYLPLPTGLHGAWTRAALAAGKHVLCEKPLCANESETTEVAEAAAGTGLVVAEALHYRYHPLLARVRDILDSGELGALHRISVAVCVPFPRFGASMYRLDLAGGAMLAVGSSAVDLARILGRADIHGEPAVESARSAVRGREVDRLTRARLRFPGGPTARVTASLWSLDLLRVVAHVHGEHGHLRVVNPVYPHAGHQLAVRIGGQRRVEHFTRRSTFTLQLEAFAAAVCGAGQVVPLAESVATQRVVDAVYRAAGLAPRSPLPVAAT